MKLERKLAVVTGGAQGIGRALALRLMAEGVAKIVVTDRNLPGAQATPTWWAAWRLLAM